jgi:hypothetical protein
MPMIKMRIIKGISIGPPVGVENVLQKEFFSVAELIQNQSGDSIDIDIFWMIPPKIYKINHKRRMKMVKNNGRS